MENYNLAQVCGTACVINLRDFVCILLCEACMVLIKVILFTLGIVYGVNESVSCFRGEDTF